jgi:dipeptide/tripeptide permease
MSILKKIPGTFWIANVIELFERWAWYGLFMLFANYLTGSTDAGALGFSQAQKGLMMGVGVSILYFLPLITGAIADKYGYKIVLFLSFIVYTSAFILLPQFTSYTGVFIMYIYLAIGSAMFKPVISATIAKTTTEETSSIGFGIFYMMVNVGAFFGPLLTLILRNNSGSYHLVFYVSAAIIALNFIMLLFYKEPEREVNKETFSKAIATVFRNVYTALKDYKFLIFLLLVAGFWTMYFQLFYSLSVFFTQWVDTSALYNFFAQHLPFFANNYGIDGQMDAEFIVNFGALYIVIFQLVVSGLVMKWKPLNTMMTGFLICSIGMALTLTTQNVLYTVISLFIFSLGEMSSSPKITEYIGRIAPQDKKALYMGCSFIPVCIGSLFAGFVSGNVYGALSDKDIFVQKEVAEQGVQLAAGLSKNEYFSQAAAQMNMSTMELTKHLWDKYNPSSIWMVVLAIGLAAALGLFLYDRFS